MTLRFYNGEYRFVLVDTEVHRCTDVVRQMQWRRPSCLSSVNFIALIYLGILCFSVVTPKVAAQDTVAPLASGNTTLDTTEMFTVTYSSYTFLTTTDIVRDFSTEVDGCIANISANDTSKICELPDCSNGLSVTGAFCPWRTDYFEYCRLFDNVRCSAYAEEFWEKDALAEKYFEDYEKVLARYDCGNDNYSMWQCEDCKLAYHDWLCATQIPYFNDKEEEIEPCEEFCIRTEARCPYFLPHKPYCGQRTFFCRGPRETARSSFTLVKQERCFTCDFSAEGEIAMSVASLDCKGKVEVVNTSMSSGAVAVSLHHTGSVYAVLHALNLYILVMWTIAPTVVAGT